MHNKCFTGISERKECRKGEGEKEKRKGKERKKEKKVREGETEVFHKVVPCNL